MSGHIFAEVPLQKRLSIDDACTSTKQSRPVKQSKLGPTSCANCGTDHTPLWRRAPDGSTVCNACGLYLKSNNSDRPNRLKKSPPKTSCSSASGKGGSCAGDGHCNGTGGSASCAGCPAFHQSNVAKQNTVCANCSATTTPLWRRDDSGATICNACGLYYKLHKSHRPVSLKKTVIKRRKRFTQFQLGQDGGSWDGESSEMGDLGNPSSDILNNNHMTTSSAHAMTHTISTFKVNEVPAIEDFIVTKKKPQVHQECLPKHIIEFNENEFDMPYHSPQSYESISQPSINEPQTSDDVSHFSHNLPSMLPHRNYTMPSYDPQPRSNITLPPIESFFTPALGLAPISPHISPNLPPSNMSQRALIGYRDELQQQVQQLSTLIQKTSTLLQGVDHALHMPISSSPPPLPPQSYPFFHHK